MAWVHNECDLLKLVIDATGTALGVSPSLSNFVDETTVAVGNDHAAHANVDTGDLFTASEDAASSRDARVRDCDGTTGAAERRSESGCQQAAQREQADFGETEHDECE